MGDDEALPLELRTIKVQHNGVWKDVPAIHRTWTVERAFPPYFAPLFAEGNTLPLGAKETWLELVGHLKTDLEWLLGLQHHAFWSQVIYDKAVMMAIVSFIQEAPPAFHFEQFPDDEMTSAFTELSRLVFFIFKRLSTAKESNQHYISPSTLGDLLYDNYIVTVPSLLDICALYGNTNRQAVSKIVQNIISCQPKYLNDLAMASDHIVQILNNSREMLKSACDVNDVLLHVYDTLSTVRIFSEISRQGHMLISPPVVGAISSFYSSTMPRLAAMTNIKDFAKLRIECIRTVRTALGFDISQVINDSSEEAAERYLAKVSEMMSEGVFVVDYNNIHPIDVDLDVLTSAFTDMDTLKVDYLLEALCSHTQVKLKPLPPKVTEKPQVFVNYPTTPASEAAGSSKMAVTGVELQSLITEVKDILPHLGSDFIEKCLKYYNFSTESVIAAVLESNLPPSIEESNWESEKPPITDTERLNVFDHDEFDVMNRDQIDTNKVYKGKKPRKLKNANQLLDDKSDLALVRDKFAHLGMVEDTMYDDEYDDTYESNDVSVKEPGEGERRRQFVTPRVLRSYEAPDEDDGDEEEDEVVTTNPVRDAFVANPEEVRARLEQKRQDNWRNRDVVGRAKGQGQDKQVLINRDRKNVHKSSGANHHRRDQASRKRNRGMIPS